MRVSELIQELQKLCENVPRSLGTDPEVLIEATTGTHDVHASDVAWDDKVDGREGVFITIRTAFR